MQSLPADHIRAQVYRLGERFDEFLTLANPDLGAMELVAQRKEGWDAGTYELLLLGNPPGFNWRMLKTNRQLIENWIMEHRAELQAAQVSNIGFVRGAPDWDDLARGAFGAERISVPSDGRLEYLKRERERQQRIKEFFSPSNKP